METKKISDEEIRVSVTKDDSDRLRIELGRSQNVLDKAQIDNLSRERLIEYICQIRHIANQTESVKHLVEGFNAKILKFGVIGAEAKSAEEVKKQTESTQGSTDMATILIKMLQEMEKRREEDSVRLKEDMARLKEEEIKKQKLREEDIARDIARAKEEEIKKDKLREEDLAREKEEESKKDKIREEDIKRQ